MHIIFWAVLLFSFPASAYNEKYTPDVEYQRDSQHWDQRRKAVQGTAKRIADKCAEYTQLHSVMAERAAGWLYRFAIPYGGSKGFIDRATHTQIEERIIAIHGKLVEDNRWERHGVMKPGALERCKANAVKAGQQVIELMKPFGAVYVPYENSWTENWKE
jgi:hypothetical protein